MECGSSERSMLHTYSIRLVPRWVSLLPPFTARQPSLRLLPASSSHDSGAKDVHSICTELKAWLCFLPLLKMLLSVLDNNDFIFSGVVVT